ncbi:MAG: hypothetical protein LQ352_002123 [Teloschistes flavicans]|nr:MAG: hypothetical protein LQ352_002123 [Teloschistes flavicans]
MDDQTTLLRNSLAVQERPAGVRNSGLAVIGGTTLPVDKLGQEIGQILSHQFLNKQFFSTMESFATSDMVRIPSTTGLLTVLSLVDLDGPYAEDLTAAKFNVLQTIWAIAATVIWVTCGLRQGRPLSSIMNGIIDTVKNEHTNLSVLMYDLEHMVTADSRIRKRTATNLAITLLRSRILHEWGLESSLLWTSEPDVSVKDGIEYIIRLLPDREKNQRYNSQRRDVLISVDLAREPLELVGTGLGKLRSWELHRASPLKLFSALAIQSREIRITHSLLPGLAVGCSSFLRPCLGIDGITGEAVLVLPASSASPAKIPASWCISLPGKPSVSTLAAIAINLITNHILSLVPQGATLLINNSNPALQTALRSKAPGKKIDLTFTSTKPRRKNDSYSVCLYTN